MGELDNGKPIVAYCQVGLRGYLATRILLQAAATRQRQRGYTSWCNGTTEQTVSLQPSAFSESTFLWLIADS